MKNKNLATIHILKNKLALSEENYRALLLGNYNVTSSKELPTSQQIQLIALLNSQLISQQKTNSSSYKQQGYILFLSKNKITDLPAYCSKIVKRSIANIKELSKSEAISVINSLQRYYKVKSDKGSHEITPVH